jgi:hypothetical protein
MSWTAAGAAADASYKPKVKEPSEQPTGPVPTPGRWIGVLKKGSSCPAVPGWRTESLFELAVAHAEDGAKRACDQYGAPPKRTLIDRERQAKRDALFRKHGLDRFCVYTDEGQGQEFRMPAGLSKAEPDQMALTPSAPTDLGPLGDQIWEPLAEHFLDQVGRVRLGPAQKPTVRLVFVDTHPTGEGPPAKDPAPSSWHGYGMAHLANEIVCGHDTSPQGCPIHIATRLALRHDDYHSASPDDPGSDTGGHQGRIGDLAIAILAEIEHWQNSQPEAKLILNLSIGWDGEYQDPDAKKREELEASAKAVYDALDYAHDLGVLVITAAGNRSGAHEHQEPFLPAGWESRSWLSSLFSKKVAYAVGGVDWQGLPLPNARPDGMPWRVAYADHAVARTSDGAGGVEPTQIYTGSSVAAVVASSTAAVVWHLRPDLAPAQVMKRMAHAAEALPDKATYYVWKPLSWLIGPPHLKRLSLCRTVLRLCGTAEGRCPAVESINCQLQECPAADLSRIRPRRSSPVAVIPIVPKPSCDPKTQVYVTGLPVSGTTRCPIETRPDMNAPSLSLPQPPETPCPPCTIAPGFSASQLASLALSLEELSGDDTDDPKPYSLAASIDSEWLGLAAHTTISSAILVIECGTDSPIKERLDLTTQFQVLLSDARHAAETSSPAPMKKLGFGPIEGRTTLAGCTASVDFTLLVTDTKGITSEKSIQSPVYVDP